MGEVDDSGVKGKVQEWLEWDKVCLLLTPTLCPIYDYDYRRHDLTFPNIVVVVLF